MPKCKICKKGYERQRQCQVVCSYECSLEYAKQQQIKKARKAKTEFKRNDKSELKKLAQQLINRYARLRDEKERGLKCCTCGHDKGQFDGGHFLPTSTYPAIRYNTNQIHLQCKNCNRFNGGKPKEYREFMIKKYGINYIEKLEAQHRVSRNYTVEYYQKLIRVVRKKIKTISNR
jgi:5-methylcytosine-specific restriction endonuclease McrA